MDTRWCRDGIQVSGLQLRQLQHVGKDAWGRAKEQPVSVTVKLSLRQAFDFAAASDRVDASTVHYGTLSKALAAINPVSSWETLDEFAQRLYSAVLDVVKDAQRLDHCDIEISLPKATLLGSRISFTHGYHILAGIPYHRLTRTLFLDRVQMPVLIGVNANERKQKQPLLVSLWVYGIAASVGDEYVSIENILVQIIEHTVFETLESLASTIIQDLSVRFLQTKASGASLRLRIEKPLAVPFADAPAIEMFRTSAELARLSVQDSIQQRTEALDIYRPYRG